MSELYDLTFTDSTMMTVKMYNVLAELNAVAVFAVSRDFQGLSSTTTFRDSRYFSAIVARVETSSPPQFSLASDASSMHTSTSRGSTYFTLSRHNRFKYCNTFDASRSHDALFYLLAVWNELQLSAEIDELHIVGEPSEREWTMGELRNYLKNIYTLNPTADLSRAPATFCKGMPFDMMTFITRGV